MARAEQVVPQSVIDITVFSRAQHPQQERSAIFDCRHSNKNDSGKHLRRVRDFHSGCFPPVLLTSRTQKMQTSRLKSDTAVWFSDAGAESSAFQALAIGVRVAANFQCVSGTRNS